MRVLKQILASLAIAVAGLALWIWLVPGAADSLEAAGVPPKILAWAAPSSGAAGAGGTAGTGRARAANAAPFVVTKPAATGVLNDRLNAIGSGEAIRSVTVASQVAGTLVDISIVSGETVKKGQVLARLDNAEQKIAVDQARVALKSATEKSQLYRTIKSTVSRMEVFDAEIAEEAAKLALQTAEFNLGRRDITAPIDGVVGIVPVNVGDNVDTQTAIVSLDDRSEILVDYWIPERFIQSVSVGMPVEATSIARAGEIFTGTVAAVDNRVDAASRTLRVRAQIPNKGDALRAGMSFSVSMQFPGDQFPAVDPLAVQWDSDGSFVWRIAQGKAERVRVQVIQRNPEKVLVKGELKDGDDIAVEGLLRIREGADVRLAGADDKDKDTPPAAMGAAT